MAEREPDGPTGGSEPRNDESDLVVLSVGRRLGPAEVVRGRPRIIVATIPGLTMPLPIERPDCEDGLCEQ